MTPSGAKNIWRRSYVNGYRALSNDTDREKRRIRRRICRTATLFRTNTTRKFSCGVLKTNLMKIQYGVARGFKWLGLLWSR